MQNEKENIGMGVELITPKGMINLADAADLLLEQMKLVKSNPASIPQAQAMCEISGRLVDITKSQVMQGQLVISLHQLKKRSSNLL